MKKWIVVLVLFGMTVGCNRKVPLRVVQSGDKVIIDVQTLGEYPTTVNRIRLLDKESEEVIWELVAQTGTPQLNVIDLRTGENSAVLSAVASGTYAVVKPFGRKSFTLLPRIEYEIEVWGSDSNATGTFQLTSQPSG